MKTAQEYYQEFLHLKAQPIVQRARGVSFNRIAFWTINVLIITVIFTAPIAIRLKSISYELYYAFAAIVGYMIFIFPERFYHQQDRRKRRLRRKYPAVYQAIQRLRNRGESVLYNIPALYLDNNPEKPYFLVSYYVRNRWWQHPRWIRLTGWVLFDALGRVVSDTVLFAKAFVSQSYAYTGGVEIYGRYDADKYEYRFALHKYLPRVERLLRRKKAYLQAEGRSYEWQEIMKRIPRFYQAVQDALLIYEPREKFARAIGYSFGYEIWYEDAVHMEKVYRAFAEYMSLSYQQDCMEALKHLKTIWDEVRWNRLERYVLDLFGKTLERVVKNIWLHQTAGMPLEVEWQAYVSRLEEARRKGFPIMGAGDVTEEYPFRGALYHTDIFERFTREQA
ncbi:MAG: hypothetical protein Fur0043_27960 [Anaerolineales bacterium]